ncbi:MAG: monomethylamine:corrinoid methyltransferase, partial [Candidatus Bathyarchaeota archaeon]
DCIGTAMLDNVWELTIGGATPPFRITDLAEECATAWTGNIARLAVFRNNKGITAGGAGSSRSGLCTEMQFYEIAVGRIACEPRTALFSGGASAHNSEDDYINGMTTRWNIELGNEITGIGLTDANDMVKTLLKNPKYKIGNEPDGMKFQEAYNLETVQPTQEYQDMYNKMTKEVRNVLGISPK